MKSFIKQILPSFAVVFLRKVNRLRVELTNSILFAMGRTKIGSNLVYLFSPEFSNEHHAVLQGRKAYEKSLHEIWNSCALLRRNTHRLEKGLIMRPRRSVFAEAFILETVECYSRAVRSTQLDSNELKWATDVLDEYLK